MQTFGPSSFKQIDAVSYFGSINVGRKLQNPSMLLQFIFLEELEA
jgi:hypothetical protein